MKHLIILLLIVQTAAAQDTTYVSTVQFKLPDSVENGMTFQRRATFEALIYNQRNKTITIQYTVDFLSTDGSKMMRSLKPYAKEVVISNGSYVLSSNGSAVGAIDQVLAKYGKATSDSTAPYKKLPDDRYELSTPVMGEYDYLIKSFDNPSRLHNIIRAIGQREAANLR